MTIGLKVVCLLVGFGMPLAFGQEKPTSELPADFPTLRFSVNPTYHSLGVKLGHILNVRRHRPILRTFEGELMLGFGTNPGPIIDRQCEQDILQQEMRSQEERRTEAISRCSIIKNPWPFSTLSRRTFDLLNDIKAGPTVIYYVNYYVAPSFLLMRTRNQVLNAFRMQPDLRIDPSFRIPTWQAVHPQAGVITGRVIQASLEYPIRKTYEVVIQEGENANNFRAMSVADGNLFRYITRAMLTGKQLRIEYIQLYRPHGAILSSLFNYMTNFRIISVEILPN